MTDDKLREAIARAIGTGREIALTLSMDGCWLGIGTLRERITPDQADLVLDAIKPPQNPLTAG